ncbi:hypothetical protein TBR22_A43160 [Luteitalea sp. TBR-22]|uniref:cytochrome P450 n=1 Tax=Luteitalea sp. TBR-22 TaxID=2802971 RepID=UPI001AF09650|nr:cytochrome P450 [Luteitalea sp. TBR-22]BCS35090.1 hypothetical protein TBR22_A43160 [Luteitalea sp. TBR-22]
MGDTLTDLRADALFVRLRTCAPTLVLGDLAFVTRHADVREVLSRPGDFSVDPYGEAIARVTPESDFLLGQADGESYRRQLGWLRAAFPPDAVPQATAAATRHAAAATATAGTSLDLLDGFARPVAALVCDELFGLALGHADTTARWARDIFTEGFVNVLRLPLLTRRARRSAGAFGAALDARIAAVHRERQGGVSSDDGLGRLLAMQEAGDAGLTDARIADLLLWTVAGTVDNVATATCRVVHEWLDRPAVLAQARAAVARADDDEVWRLAREALRFGTPTPMVVRRCRATCAIARGTSHEAHVPAGALVLVGVGAAMMDPDVLEAPAEFQPGRPAEHYLHFGVGMHRCLGAHLASAIVAAMVSAVVSRAGLRRGSGLAGRLRMAGPFPKRFTVRFDA